MSLPQGTQDTFGRIEALPMAAAVTIGNYDGVHCGHQSVLQHLVAQAKARNLTPLVVTFEPLPVEYFQGKAVARLGSQADKTYWLAQLFPKIAHCLVLPFDRGLAEMSAETFIQDILVEALRTRYLSVGEDFRFGHQRKGDIALLQEAGAQHSFEIEPVPLYQDQGARISSTRIRDLLATGETEAAEILLGHPLLWQAQVVQGDQRGRQLGFPTANLDLSFVPALRGVFTVTAQWVGNDHAGVANIGTRPTLDGTRLVAEVHLFDFDEDLYDQTLTVRFHQRLRDEQRFDSVEALRAQIERDVSQAREYFAHV